MIRFKCEKNNEVDGEDNSSGGHGGDAAFALKVCVVWQEVKVGDEHLCVFVYVSGWGTGAGGEGGGVDGMSTPGQCCSAQRGNDINHDHK